MSKSKGEFLTVSLLEEKGYDPLAYRFFCLQSHYRKGLLFTWENLDNAAVAYQQAARQDRRAEARSGRGGARRARRSYKAKFRKAMDNDLNTSMGVTVLYDVLKAKTNDATKLAAARRASTACSVPEAAGEGGDAAREAGQAAPAAGGFTVVSESGEEDADDRSADPRPRRGEEGEELRRGRPHPR